jgi:hypothetical protein
MNDRRKKILNEIVRRGLRLKVIFNVYGSERDAFISESRAVLNLHYYDSQIFQQIRAFYPLTNSVPIVSEIYPLDSAPDIYSEVIFYNHKEESIEDYTLRIFNSLTFEAEVKSRLVKFKETDVQNQLSDIIARSIDWLNKK